MRLFGFEISRTKAAPGAGSPVSNPRAWWPVVREPFAGAWQKNIELRADTVLSNPLLFRCVSLIASDVSKMRCRLVAQDSSGIWTETESPAYSPVLRKPNRYQNRIQFFAYWIQSKLAFGNTYVLKERDNRNVVTALYVLDPMRVRPVVAPDGGVYYQLSRDDLSGIDPTRSYVPASEIIHDRWNCFFHPLVGLSPIYAAGMAALQGLKIQGNSLAFFENGSNPGGVLTAPGEIGDEVALRLKEHWETNYTGANVGKVAVLGDGLEYKPMAVNAVDAQLVEQLKWTAEVICGVYGVPGYMAGVGSAPLNNNVQSLAELYYAQCLQPHIESLELCLDEGLEMAKPYGTEFDLDDLLRMDTATQIKMLADGVKGAIYKPDEARRKLNLGPVEGGDVVYLQQQNYSLPALAKRDAKDDPFATGSDKATAPTATPSAAAANDDAALEAAAANERAAQSELVAQAAMATSEIWKALA